VAADILATCRFSFLSCLRIFFSWRWTFALDALELTASGDALAAVGDATSRQMTVVAAIWRGLLSISVPPRLRVRRN
jgi:hypothetical protein